MKRYKANRTGYITYLLIGFLLFPIVFFLLDPDALREKPLTILLLTSPFLILFWIYADTSYTIADGELRYRSGFLSGKIEIHSITEIIEGKTSWSGTKPALAKNGLIIKFTPGDEVYIAPENNDELIADLLQLNPEIKISKHR